MELSTSWPHELSDLSTTAKTTAIPGLAAEHWWISEVYTAPGGLVALWTLKKGQRTKTWPPIHSYENCSMAQGNIKERFASASWEPSHAIVHDIPDGERFSFSSLFYNRSVSSIVSIISERSERAQSHCLPTMEV